MTTTQKPRTKKPKTTNEASDSSTIDKPKDASSPSDVASPIEPFCRDLGDKRIDFEEIQPSPLNPRKWFNPEMLARLAELIQKHGQQQNITVRKMGAWYELISGERRWRAIQLTNLTHLNCKVLECDDNTAIELRGEENYFRSDFNPIEEAIWFQQMLEIVGYNQTTLGEYLKISPSQVSNRLRLLKLPEAWQQRVIDGSLPGTHARSLVPWAERTAVLAKLASDFESKSIAEITVKAFEQWIIGAVHSNSRSMTPGTFGGPKFEITDELKAELDIEEVPEFPGATRTSPRAFNIALWDHEQAEALTEATATNRDNDDESDDEVDSAADETIATTSTSAKAPAVDPQETVSHLGQFAHEAHFIGFIGSAIIPRLKPDALTLRLFLSMVCKEHGELFMQGIAKGQDRQLDEYPPDIDVYAVLSEVTLKSLPGEALEFVASLLRVEPERHFSLPLLMQLANELDIEPLKVWQPNDEMIDLCSTVQLRELFTDEMADAKKLAKWDRKRLKKELLEHWPEGYLPPLMIPKELSDCLTQEEEKDDDESDEDLDDH